MTTTPATYPASAEGLDGAVGASPLGSARYALGQLITDFDAVVAHLAGQIAEAERERLHLRERVEQAEAVCGSVVAHLHRVRPADAEEAVTRLAEARAALGSVEARLNEMSIRQSEAAGRAASAREVQNSLDDLAGLAAADAAAGAARFRSASRQVFQIIEEERMRIARDMHDGPAQTLANLVLQAEVLERLVAGDAEPVRRELEDFKQGVRTALEDTRRLIFDLRPMTLDDLGLVPTLRRLVKEFGERTGVATRFHLVGADRRLVGRYEAVVFRIVQEALTNVRKHAHASGVEVVTTMQPRRVSVVVKDDGEGFDVAATEAREGRTRHLGLILMRERVDLEKGDFEVRSQLGRGTEVRVAFDC